MSAQANTDLYTVTFGPNQAICCSYRCTCMRFPWVLGVSSAVALFWWSAGRAEENVVSTAPATYRAISSRVVYPEPALPALGSAGYRFRDPTFGSSILRVTDANTRPGPDLVGRSYTTPSAAHQLAWNATSTLFYIRSVDGFYIPYSFNPTTMTVSRIQPSTTGHGGLTIVSQAEPQFSYLLSNILYGTRQDPVNDWPIVRQFDFDTLSYTDVVNLGSLATISSATYAGALSSSATLPEKIAVMFGGTGQDKHFKVAVFRASPPGGDAVVLDSRASTITAVGTTTSTNIELGVFLHHVWLDRSGRYVLLEPVAQTPVPYYVWDLDTNVITGLNARANGHMATGFGHMVNQDCCTTSTSWDAAQWQLRALATPDTTSDLIAPVLTPQEIYLADHTSWNNAQLSALVPILSSPYRYHDGSLNDTPWRAWDDEIVAIQTSAGSAGATVWRFAHHRSNVAYEGSGPAVYFWYLPRASISPNGWWAIFTSNWEKTLGEAVGAEPGGAFRSDVFLVALARGGLDAFTDDPLTPAVSSVRSLHIEELRTRIDELRSRFGLAAFAWTDSVLGAGTFVRAVHFTEMRHALEEAYAAAGRAAPTYTDPTIVPGTTVIRVVHVQELRDAVIALETS